MNVGYLKIHLSNRTSVSSPWLLETGQAAFHQSCHFGRSRKCLQIANPAIATPAEATAELDGLQTLACGQSRA